MLFFIFLQKLKHPNMKVGEKLRLLRKLKGFTQ